MWIRFTERARSIVFDAVAEARHLSADAVSAEHITLALLRGEDTIAAQLFTLVEAPKEEIRQAVLARLPVGETAPAEKLGLDAAAKQAIDSAYGEARLLNDTFISSEHLLLGILNTESAAREILHGFGATLERVRAETHNLPADIRGKDTGKPLYAILNLIFVALWQRRKRR